MTQRGATYKVLGTVKKVLVNVPTTGNIHMQPVDAHKFTTGDGQTVEVPFHWRHGQPVGDTGVIINRHFFGITAQDREPKGTRKNGSAIPRKIMATVEVVEKKTGSGARYILFNITKDDSEDRPEFELKLILDGKRTDEDIMINGAGGKGFVHFKPIPVREEEPAVNEAANS